MNKGIRNILFDKTALRIALQNLWKYLKMLKWDIFWFVPCSPEIAGYYFLSFAMQNILTDLCLISFGALEK